MLYNSNGKFNKTRKLPFSPFCTLWISFVSVLINNEALQQHWRGSLEASIHRGHHANAACRWCLTSIKQTGIRDGRHKHVHCFNTNCHSTGSNNCCSLFLMMRDMKSARIGAIDNKEHDEMLPGSAQEEMVPGHYRVFTYTDWAVNKSLSASFTPSSLMLPSINHYITREPMDLIVLCFNQIVYIDSPMKNICLGLCTPWPSMDRCASFWGGGGGCGEEPGRSVPGKVQ